MDKKIKARFLLADEVNEKISDELLDFNFDLIEAQVLAYCNRKDFPTGLMLLVIQMVAEYTQANYYEQMIKEKIDRKELGKVSSVSRGDTTISYGDNAKVTEYGSPGSFNADDFMKNYNLRLMKYRKVRAL